MNKLSYLLIAIITFNSCSKECDCNSLIGQRFYLNLKDYYDDCTHIDDLELRKDGYINLYRYGGGHDGQKMEKALKYKVKENCIFEFYGVDSSKVLIEKECSFFSMSILNIFDESEVETLALTEVDCDGFNVGIIRYLNYNPR